MQNPSRTFVLAACVVGLLLPTGLTGCSAGTRADAAGPGPAAERQFSPSRVGVEEFATIIAGPAVQIIDVRTPEEFSAGHLAGAVNIPVSSGDFADRIAGLAPAGTYAVYCRSGNRSQPAVAAMTDAGLTHIYELSSGTNGWTAAGRPLVR